MRLSRTGLAFKSPTVTTHSIRPTDRMNHCQLTEHVRLVVDRYYKRIGLAEDERSETLLMQNGEFCGRRFHFGDCSAVWFVEEDELKFYDSQGLVMEVAQPSKWQWDSEATSQLDEASCEASCEAVEQVA